MVGRPVPEPPKAPPVQLAGVELRALHDAIANGVKDDACGQSVTFLGVDVALPADWCPPT